MWARILLPARARCLAPSAVMATGPVLVVLSAGNGTWLSYLAAMVLVLLCWSVRTPWGWGWRWPVTIFAVAFVLLVGVSRIYLGVHYPSDILAGWTAASAWVVGVYALVFYGTLRPWQPHAARTP